MCQVLLNDHGFSVNIAWVSLTPSGVVRIEVTVHLDADVCGKYKFCLIVLVTTIVNMQLKSV